jgi:alpha-D-xyloside xylohydrolase
MRLHGDREPKQQQLGNSGGAACRSGAPNEAWSYGGEVYEILKKYLQVREGMRDYVRGLMREAHEKGTPVMRTMFYEFPNESHVLGGRRSVHVRRKVSVCTSFEGGSAG